MATPENFCAFILTHGRPTKVYTYSSLRRAGYTGPIFLLVDDEDGTADEYERLYPGEVIVFGKADIAATFDEGDMTGDRRSIIYARNACFPIAEELGFRDFIQLDDDYTSFSHRFNGRGDFVHASVKSLDDVWGAMRDYMRNTPCLSVAMAQGGDYIGGEKGSAAKSIGTKRKVMNSFICSTDRPFQFFGRINEDVNVYTELARRGALFLTILQVQLNQRQTQTNAGGMTDLYLDSGTYVKSFYSVMYCPSSVTIQEMGATNKRLHHHVNWRATTPMIIDERWKK